MIDLELFFFFNLKLNFRGTLKTKIETKREEEQVNLLKPACIVLNT